MSAARPKEVNIKLTNAQITALLNADEAGGRIPAQANVIRALHVRGLATSPSRPSHMTADGREVVRQVARDHFRTTFTITRPDRIN